MDNKFFEELKKKIQPYFEKSGSHSFDHTQRVYNLCLHIAKKEKVDLNVLKVSALLHDIARKKQSESKEKICHAEEGAKIARKILEKMNFPDDKIEKVVYAVSVHRYSKRINPDTTEAKILQDADRLDALGAITIARIFDYGARKNRPMHNPKLILKEYKHNSESESAINHFYEKILKIKPENFHTKTAREIAKDRYVFVKDFVERFIDEWEGRR